MEIHVKMAEDLMSVHNLVGWKCVVGSAKNILGKCIPSRKTIRLSKHLLNNSPLKTIKNTILHEIAHALTPGQKHNDTWKQKAIQIGCDGKRCSKAEIFQGVAKYTLTCASGCCINRHKKTKRLERILSCKKHKLELKVTMVD